VLSSRENFRQSLGKDCILKEYAIFPGSRGVLRAGGSRANAGCGGGNTSSTARVLLLASSSELSQLTGSKGFLIQVVVMMLTDIKSSTKVNETNTTRMVKLQSKFGDLLINLHTIVCFFHQKRRSVF
jgi:hypothetical protein